ncbi:hypothetical protein [Bradyrhizobium sp. DOA1]|uniref:hypothetical protein n=1 Tax=Bradyrhizobium sp. DOA1 TaxID=1126616 RepID=UPI001FD9FCBC|nr:hypothetical protein [Bradyrhizobium sp. DOA1]
MLRGGDFTPSEKAYDWLGPGVYFWEGDPVRAWEWARDRGYSDPFVVGAIIDLGECLDLTLRENLEYLSVAYKDLQRVQSQAKSRVPVNKDGRRLPKRDKVLRFLDCAVITHLHHMVADAATQNPSPRFDTVRGLFEEGKPAFRGAGFYSRTHTQIAVLNQSLIRGVFRPRSLDRQSLDRAMSGV